MKKIFDIEIEYSLLTEEDVTVVTKCIAKNFSDRDPITTACKITEEEFYPFALKYCQLAAKSGLSYVAKDKNGKIAGCIINSDIMDSNKVDLADVSDKFLPIFSLLEQLNKLAFEKIESPKEGEILHIIFVAVDSNYARLGIAGELMKRTVQNAIENKKFEACYAECSDIVFKIVQQKISTCLTGTKIGLKDFEYENKKPFSELEDKNETITFLSSKNTLELKLKSESENKSNFYINNKN